MKRILGLLFPLLLLGALSFAADISGRWKGQFQGGDATRELTFDFKGDRMKLSGTVSGLLDRKLEIEEGKVEGDTVSFWVMSEWQGQPVKLVYKGKIAGEEIRFTMGTEDGSWGTELIAKRAS